MNYYSNIFYFLVSLEREKEAKDLYESVIIPRCKQQGLGCEYHSFGTGRQFGEIIANIEKDIRDSKLYPHIHFEAHGSKDGVLLLNELRLNWGALTEYFTRINDLSRNNLVVSMATCFGGYFTVELLRSIKSGDESRCPAFCLLGPVEETNFGQLEIGYNRFFNELLVSRNLNKAIHDFNSAVGESHQLVLKTCQSVFKEFIDNYVENTLSKQLTNRSEFNKRRNTLKRLYTLNTGKYITGNLNKVLEDKMFEKEFYLETLNKLRKTYFWIDKYPENEERFKRFDISNWPKIENLE